MQFFFLWSQLMGQRSRREAQLTSSARGVGARTLLVVDDAELPLLEGAVTSKKARTVL